MRLVGKTSFYHCAGADLKEFLFGKSLEAVRDTAWGCVWTCSIVVEFLLLGKQEIYLIVYDFSLLGLLLASYNRKRVVRTRIGCHPQPLP